MIHLEDEMDILVRESQLHGALISLGLAVVFIICGIVLKRAGNGSHYRRDIMRQRGHLKIGEDILNSIKNINHENGKDTY